MRLIDYFKKWFGNGDTPKIEETPSQPLFHLIKPAYEKSLVELISLSLDRHSLDEIVSAIEEGKETDVTGSNANGHGYIRKILSEEIEKQFTEEYRPFVELILNGIDAKPQNHEGNYKVRVDLSSNSFSVSDEGSSMGLRDILRKFIIPFSSEKDSLRDIGRFGVGFFSNLAYCLDNPNKTKLVVETNNGGASYNLTFGASDNSLDSIAVRIEEGKRKTQGTTVSLKGHKLDAGDLTNYLREYFRFFDTDRAVIIVDHSQLNTLPPGTTYKANQTFSHRGKPIEQPVRVTVQTKDCNWKDAKLRMYSQGIFILEKGLYSHCGGLRFDLPSVVDVVEGRDEFKIEGNYWSAVRKLYDVLLQHAHENVGDKEVVERLRELVPNAANQLERTPHNAEEFRKVLFPEEIYLLVDNWSTIPEGELSDALAFFGKEIEGKLYQPKTYEARQFWQGRLAGLKELSGKYSEVLTQGNTAELQGYMKSQSMPFNNIASLPNQDKFTLVRTATAGGYSPFIKVDGQIYVRADHQFFQKPDDFASYYGVMTSYQRTKGVNEKGLEDQIIAK